MQHFGSRIKSEVKDEWRQHYVNYADLKKLIGRVEAQRLALEKTTAASTTTKPERSDADLCGELSQNLEQAIIRADAFAQQLLSQTNLKFSVVLEANSDILDPVGSLGGTLGDTLLSGFLTRTSTNTASAGRPKIAAASSAGVFPAQPMVMRLRGRRSGGLTAPTVGPHSSGAAFPSSPDASRTASAAAARLPSPPPSPKLAQQQQQQQPNFEPPLALRKFAKPSAAPSGSEPTLPSPPRVTIIAAPASVASELRTVTGDADEKGNDHDRGTASSPSSASAALLGAKQQNDNNNYDQNESTADSIFDAVMARRDSKKGQQDHNAPDDIQLALLVELNAQLIDLFRFVEINQLSIQRLSSKYQKYVLDPFISSTTSADDPSSSSGYGSTAETGLQQQQHGGGGGSSVMGAPTAVQSVNFIRTGQRITNLVESSPLRERLIQCERWMLRVRETAEKLHGKEADKWFVRGQEFAAEQKHWVIKSRYTIISFLLLFIMLALPIFKSKHANNCAAMIVMVAALWVLEAIPFFATALFIPLLAVPLGVLPNVTHKESAKVLLGSLFSGTQVLVLGGLSMGRALSKHRLEMTLARYCLKPVAHHPRTFVLVLMLVSALASAVLSNVAAPVLMLNVVQPTLWRMPRASGGPQAILLCLAWAGNFGGLLSPNSSPQNAVAEQALTGSSSGGISYTSWLLAASPVALSGILFGWWLIVFVIWKPFSDPSYVIPIAVGDSSALFFGGDGEGGGDEPDDELAAALMKRNNNGSSASEQALMSESVEKALVLATCAVTIILWCLPLQDTFGDTSVVALIPVVIFFGVGVLSKDDFNGLSWHLLFLLAGGNMLGICTRESGLLQEVISSIKPFLANNSQLSVVSVLIISIAVITTFVSHTVAALILMPVIVEISAVNQDLPSSSALVFLSVLMCSGSMAFPVSSFPNVNSLLAEDEHGETYLEPKHFLLPGALLSLLCIGELISFMLPLADMMWPKV